jgi:hypothetical protein
VTLAALLLAGCGGAGYGEIYYEEEVYAPATGEVEVQNATPAEVLTWFGMGLSGTGSLSGDLVPDLFPGEQAYAGAFYEDWYDAEADLEDGFGFVGTVFFQDVFVEAGFTTEFQVF